MKKLTEEFNKVTVAKGEMFSIELDSNPSTGYRWDLQLKAGKASLVDEDFISDAPKNSMVCGAGGKKVFIFKAEEAGTIEIDATYKRPWKSDGAAQSQSFKITVK